MKTIGVLENGPTSSKAPLVKRILMAPLLYTSSWPMIPSTGSSDRDSGGTGEESEVAAAGFISAAKDTFLTDGSAVGGSTETDEDSGF